ncbi:MAG: GIY-YIG nuclease family protein [Arthrospira sp. SH-MAG29]|nr:GIY-YIG nuclease family protein [Arthrospira sp. SH-MAG29]MBS0015902.1 GIY-YIG nuclease family protein [Arthrospira sp. SH-MAG29]
MKKLLKPNFGSEPIKFKDLIDQGWMSESTNPEQQNKKILIAEDFPGVYVLYAPTTESWLYVGKAQSLVKRINNRKHTAVIRARKKYNPLYIIFYRLENDSWNNLTIKKQEKIRQELIRFEGYMIGELNPSWNGGKVYWDAPSELPSIMSNPFIKNQARAYPENRQHRKIFSPWIDWF